MTANNPVYIDTPGHGYLRVSVYDVNRLALTHGWEPSEFSCVHGGVVYLEEDCDAPAYCERSGVDLSAVPVQHRSSVPGSRYQPLGASGRKFGV